MNDASYIVLSRQSQLFTQMAVIANNLANADTDGFKADKLIANKFDIKSGDPQKPNDKISFTTEAGTYPNMEQGEYQPTGRPLDAAIHGNGFFIVRTPLGDRYTRDGGFHVNAAGVLVNQDGYPILSQDRQEISFQDTDDHFTIDEDGTITVPNLNGVGIQQRGQIGVVRFNDMNLLEKTAHNMFKTTSQPIDVTPDDNVTVEQGQLEKSNVSPIREVSNMIEVSRMFTMTSNFEKSMHDLEMQALTTISKQ